MSARFWIHVWFLVAAAGLTYFWTKSPALSFYTLQGIAALVLLYFANHFFGRRNYFSLVIDGFIFALITLLLVTQTGGLASPLFFLFYILLCGLSLLFEPLSTLIFTLVLILFYANEIKDLNTIIQIVGLVVITPMALFFGKQYLALLEGEEKIKVLEQKSKKLGQEVATQESETLLWLSLNFREHVTRIVDTSSNLLADLSHLTLRQKENLQKIHSSAQELIKLGEKLREKIEG